MKTTTTAFYAIILTLLAHTSVHAEGMNPALWAQIYDRMQTSQAEVAQATGEGDIHLAALPSPTTVGSRSQTQSNPAAEVARRLMAQIAF